MEEHKGKKDETLVLATKFSPSKLKAHFHSRWRGFYNPPSLNRQQGWRYPRSPSRQQQWWLLRQRLQLPAPTPLPLCVCAPTLLPSSRQSNQRVLSTLDSPIEVATTTGCVASGSDDIPPAFNHENHSRIQSKITLNPSTHTAIKKRQ